jgi:RNA polymerase sigma factor (sigma-70 family)
VSLIESCLKRDEAAMKAFYERFYGFALSVCMSYANDPEDAREMLNDGFLKVFKNLKELKTPDAILPWLRKIMVNTGIDYYRKNKKRLTDIPVENVEYSLAEPYLNHTNIYAQISADEIIKTLQSIPQLYRMVFALYVLEGYSHAEIAKQLNIVESTSRAYLTEANKMLRKILTAQNKHDERTKR